MELIVVLPLVMIMGAMAVFLSLSDRPAPAAARASLANGTPLQPRMAAGSSHRTSRPQVTHTDALLAETLTEMLGLKQELTGLRSRVEGLTAEVQRLSAPKTQSRRPSRKAA